jgi:AcrR family transcriptional regulator
VERLLAAATAEIAARGYLKATMCGIAARADTAIGSLYQFFPNKEAVAEALRARYAAAGEPLWAELTRQAPDLTAEQIARRLVRLMQEQVRRGPAFPALLDAPRTAGSERRRLQFRRHLAAVLRARQPRLTTAAAQRQAAVVQQLLRGLLTLGSAHAGEFEEILTRYLQPRLEKPA